MRLPGFVGSAARRRAPSPSPMQLGRQGGPLAIDTTIVSDISLIRQPCGLAACGVWRLDRRAGVGRSSAARPIRAACPPPVLSALISICVARTANRHLTTLGSAPRLDSVSRPSPAWHATPDSQVPGPWLVPAAIAIRCRRKSRHRQQGTRRPQKRKYRGPRSDRRLPRLGMTQLIGRVSVPYTYLLESSSLRFIYTISDILHEMYCFLKPCKATVQNFKTNHER